MTPKEKAEELVYKFADIVDPEMNHDYAKECALTCVEEILEATKQKYRKKAFVFNTETKKSFSYKYVGYWLFTKKEIEKL